MLVGSEPTAQSDVLGVIAVGLDKGEDLAADDVGDEGDDGRTGSGKRQRLFDTYARVARLGPVPCAVIQATRDDYLPAASARTLFGPDTPARRFYTIDARNHRFSGGEAAFDAAWLDAIHWIVTSHLRVD